MDTSHAAKDSIRFHDFPFAGVEPMSACTARAYPRHTHDQYGIGVIDAGGHASWSGRGQVEAGPRHLICVNPGEVHDGRPIGQRSRSWRILYFEPALMEETRTDILEGAQASFTFAAPVFADDRVRRVFEDAFRYAAGAQSDDPGSGDRMACETALLRLVAHLGAHSTSHATNDAGPTACIRRARERIDDDPAAPLTLVQLANEVGLSRYQLIRGFARELGLTPHAYVLQRRIALARRLIRAGHTLADAALAAGFCDQSHLTRCFLRQLGVTPRRYATHSA
jgi:AraC-like DNA-binding protein